MSTDEEESLHFQVDAALLFELGEQLVARPAVALAELIKNGYDADARKITITFDQVSKPGGTIIVRDDGNGMTFEVLRDHWMRIATNNKVANPISPRYHRVRTGAKGVGRFATRKLAQRLILTTTAQREDGLWEKTVAEFDWDKFKPGMDLHSVALSYRRETSPDEINTGTTLVMHPVRDVWEEETVREVQTDLASLTPPFRNALRPEDVDPSDSDMDPGCAILIEAPEYPDLEGEVSEQFLSAAVAKLTAKVKPDGSPLYTLRFRGDETDFTFEPEELVPDLIGATAEIHWFPYRGGTYEDRSYVKRLSKDFGGVKVYLDGYRIFPYGDPGDDWLNLDYDKGRRITKAEALFDKLFPEVARRGMLDLPGNNNVVGGVFVSRLSNPEIRPTIGRERVLDNKAYGQMQRLARLGIDWMILQNKQHELDQKRAERDRRRGQQQEHTPDEARDQTGKEIVSTDTEMPAQTASTVVREAVETVKQELTRLNTPEQITPIVKQLEEMQRLVEEREAEEIDKVSMVRVLASAGTAIAIFVHQTRAVIDGFHRLTGALNHDSWWFERDHIQSQMRTWTRVMEAQATQLGLLFGKEARKRRRRLFLRPIVEESFAPLRYYCEEQGIDLSNSVPEELRTPPMFEAELHALLLNTLSNAIKAVKAQPTRRVEARARYEGRYLLFELRDTGPGVPMERREKIFEPFETTSEPDPVLGVGTGLGLSIVRDIVISHRGSARFIDTEEPWKTCIQLAIPSGVDDENVH